MGKIDSISKALQTEYGIDLSNGKPVLNNDHNMEEKTLLPEEVIETIVEDNCIATIEENKIAEYDPTQKSVEEISDEDRVKRNIRELIEKSMDLSDDLFETVRIAESPKAYEPAAVFLKTLVELNEKLLEVHDRDRKIKAGPKQKKENNTQNVQNNTTTTQNNTIICDSPSNVLKMLKEKNNES